MRCKRDNRRMRQLLRVTWTALSAAERRQLRPRRRGQAKQCRQSGQMTPLSMHAYKIIHQYAHSTNHQHQCLRQQCAWRVSFHILLFLSDRHTVRQMITDHLYLVLSTRPMHNMHTAMYIKIYG